MTDVVNGVAKHAAPEPTEADKNLAVALIYGWWDNCADGGRHMQECEPCRRRLARIIACVRETGQVRGQNAAANFLDATAHGMETDDEAQLTREGADRVESASKTLRAIAAALRTYPAGGTDG
jgi:hypothetical protein